MLSLGKKDVKEAALELAAAIINFCYSLVLSVWRLIEKFVVFVDKYPRGILLTVVIVLVALTIITRGPDAVPQIIGMVIARLPSG